MTTIYNWLCLVGAPALLMIFYRTIYRRMQQTELETAAIKAGIQALLRAQLVADYNRYNEKGYAPLYARENFESCYQQYHALGKNGVMDDVRRRFLALPTEAEGESENED